MPSMVRSEFFRHFARVSEEGDDGSRVQPLIISIRGSKSNYLTPCLPSSQYRQTATTIINFRSGAIILTCINAGTKAQSHRASQGSSDAIEAMPMRVFTSKVGQWYSLLFVHVSTHLLCSTYPLVFAPPLSLTFLPSFPMSPLQKSWRKVATQGNPEKLRHPLIASYTFHDLTDSLNC